VEPRPWQLQLLGESTEVRRDAPRRERCAGHVVEHHVVIRPRLAIEQPALELRLALSAKEEPFRITWVEARPNGGPSSWPVRGYLPIETPEEPERAAFSFFA
jgi:hypothetical protein